jgi:hypothetical protein
MEHDRIPPNLENTNMNRWKAILCASLVGCAATAPAFAGENDTAIRDKAVMLYFTKSIGAKADKQPLAFGLRLDNTMRFDATRKVTMFDARYSLGGRRTLSALGLSMFDSSLEKNRWFAAYQGSSDGNKALWWGGAALLLIGGSCAAGEWPCEDNDSSTDTSDDESPGL